MRVRLSAFQANPPRGRASVLELTDLDVLGIDVAPDFRVRYRIAECKSGRVGAIELFWLRGVSDFFGADEAYLVAGRDRDRTSALRTLANRLQLGILVESDFERLVEAYGLDPTHSGLHDADLLGRYDELLRSTPQAVSGLSDYVGRLFWQLPLNRNLEYGISYLEQARHQDLSDRGMLCLLTEHAFRYLLALFAACEAILKRGLPKLTESVPAYLYGGEHSLREAQQRVTALAVLQQQLEGGERPELKAVFEEVPPYYDALLELITRLLRRPDRPNAMLRTLQAVTIASFANRRPITDFIEAPDALTSKLLLDVITFLAGAAGLDSRVALAFESALHGDTGDSPVQPGQRRTGPGGENDAEGGQANAQPNAATEPDAADSEVLRLPVDD